MFIVDQDQAPVNLVQHEDGVIDHLIASMTPDEFGLLLERLDDLPERVDVLQGGADVLGWLGW